MAFIGLNITMTGYAGKLIIAWKKESLPLAYIGQSGDGTNPNINPSDDFPVDTIYTIPNLQPVTHIVEFWRSDDGVTRDEFIKSWEIDAGKEAYYNIDLFTYVVGRGQSSDTPGSAWHDPEPGDAVLHDERLLGATHQNAFVESRGFGKYRPDEINWSTDDNDPGFSFNTGGLFEDGDSIFVTRINKADSTSGDTSAAPFTAIKLLSDPSDNTVDFDASHNNKLCIADFSGTVGTVVFGTLATIGDAHVRYSTIKGAQNYLKLQFAPDDTVLFNGDEVNVIYLAKNEDIELIIVSGVAYVVAYRGNAGRRGDVWPSMDANKPIVGGYLAALESTGVLNASDYPGLYEWITKLPAGVSVALSDWGTSLTINGETTYPNKRRYGINTSNQTFRVPDLSDMGRRFLKTGSDATRVNATGTSANVAGGYQHHAYQEHSHSLPIEGGGSTNRQSLVSNPNNDEGLSNADLTGTAGTGTETRMRNYGEHPYIIL